MQIFLFLVSLFSVGDCATHWIRENGRIVPKRPSKQDSATEPEWGKDLSPGPSQHADPNSDHLTQLAFYEGPIFKDLKTKFDNLKGLQDRRALSPFKEAEIGALFQAQGGVELVRSQLASSIEKVGPDSVAAWPLWSQLGNTWRAVGNVHFAIQCFRKALSIKPTDPDVLLNVAVIMQNLGYLEDALVLITEAVDLHPTGVLHHFIKGTIFQKLGRNAEAIAAYEAALKIQPNFLPCEKKLEELRGLREEKSNFTRFMHFLWEYPGFIIGSCMLCFGLHLARRKRFSSFRSS